MDVAARELGHSMPMRDEHCFQTATPSRHCVLVLKTSKILCFIARGAQEFVAGRKDSFLTKFQYRGGGILLDGRLGLEAPQSLG
jgi:hypothetical protein